MKIMRCCAWMYYILFFTCLSVSHSFICSSICQSACPSIPLDVCPPICKSVCYAVCISTSLSICMPIPCEYLSRWRPRRKSTVLNPILWNIEVAVHCISWCVLLFHTYENALSFIWDEMAPLCLLVMLFHSFKNNVKIHINMKKMRAQRISWDF